MTRRPSRPNEAADADVALRHFFTRLFHRASTPLVASLLLPACSGAEPAPLQESMHALETKSLHCIDGQWRPMSALKLALPADFVALRRTATNQRLRFTQIDAAGQPCGGAKSPRLCEAELARVSITETAQASSHLVFTRGDAAHALQSLEEKLFLLGTIDTPDEALLLLEHRNLPISCQGYGDNDLVQVREYEAGYRVLLQQPVGCGSKRTLVDVDRAGQVTILEQRDLYKACPAPTPPPDGGICCAGRRPPNLCDRLAQQEGATRLARYFADVARLEAASVPAFEQLAYELRLLGAPRALVEAARRAAEDEVRHAHETTRWAEQFGARPQLPRLSRTRLRDRAALALDNAVEGCVHETYAAYLATVQARLARGTALGETLQGIARDETAHGALAWQIAAWVEPGLTLPAQRHVAATRRRALAALGARAA